LNVRHSLRSSRKEQPVMKIIKSIIANRRTERRLFPIYIEKS
jgi:hypothetical protein